MRVMSNVLVYVHCNVIPPFILRSSGIFKFLQYIDCTFKIKKLPVQQQQGASDCGLFSIAYATETCLGNDVTTVGFDQRKLRKQLLNCLQKHEMSSSPRSSKIIHRSVSRVESFKLYCMCRMPEDYDVQMVQCSGRCKRWYHFACVAMTRPVQNFWKCPKCVSGEDFIPLDKPLEFK